MSRITLYLIAIIAIFLISAKPGGKSNVNTWNIRIGGDTILSWQKNEMGDTAVIKINELRNDTLFAQRYLCGHSRGKTTTSVTIKTAANEVVAERIIIGEQWIFESYIPFKEILKSRNIETGQVLSVYFTIKIDDINQTVLLGNLKIK